ncbi:hypothetical protein F6V30_02255 [Oryzomonas sagensis]|uniref:HD-CE domain-containing protein n=1 Tax=Oryzomonas sagensis TaxID=2603857 RepID=A0ABQ6TR11_9BACT|nr:ATP-binding protein [Oryzomonas sagensis]KAB0671423.1 hypothetical protein F6V30_02255 [Oryzomonas sagensis]
MGQYAEQVVTSKLFKQFDALVNYEDIVEADVTTLKQLVLDTADFVGPYLDRIRITFQQYTEHDLRHLCNVADLVYRFLPKQQGSPQNGLSQVEAIRLNAVELAFLWLAILLHDAGMFVSDKEKEETLKSEDYLHYLRHCQDQVTAAHKAREQGLEVKARTIEDALLAEYFRRLHPERVYPFITEKLSHTTPLKFRDVSLYNDIAELCESHAWGVRESNNPRDLNKCVARMEPNRRIKSFRVNLRYLACCLRLGDILDFDRSRTPLPVYEEIDFTEDASFKEWNKHLSIEGWNVDEHRVLFEARCTHPAYYVAVHDFLNWVDEELRECRYLLDDAPAGDEEKYSLKLAHAADRRQVRMSDSRYVAGGFRFQLEYEEIMRLLMDKSLYPDSTLFLRELLQNALDACRYQEALAKDADMADKYKPRIMVWDYSEDPVSPRVIFQDNGIGMSQQHVENFFLRVGKSFYRSPEFLAERQRLASHNVHLDACSQFGIGFLSCFLGGDTITVETWRYGNAPLKITITGPNKYFLIERLPEPTGTIQFKSPSNELEDGPPWFSGTRITVHLKEGWHVCTDKPGRSIVHQTLETFAVNQEYDILVYREATGKPETIERRRWEKAEPLFCNKPTPKKTALFPFLAPLVFNLQDYSDELRGQAAIWMLKGPDGNPAPECGFLSIMRRSYEAGISVRINSTVLELFNEICRLIRFTEAKDRKSITNFVVNDILFKSFDTDELFDNLCDKHKLREEIEEFIANNEDDFIELTSKERNLISRLCKIISKQPNIEIGKLEWHQSIDCVHSLVIGDITALIKSMRTNGIPDLGSPLRFEKQQLLGLFGINVPGLIVSWEPAKGAASQRTILPDSVSMRIDAYGALAPKPSASRLFVPDEYSLALRIAIGRALVRYTTTIFHEHRSDPVWKRWYHGFLKRSAPIEDAILEEIATINDFIDIECCIQGELSTLKPRQLVDVFGETALVIKRGGNLKETGIFGSEISKDGIFDTLFLPTTHWILKFFPRVKTPDGKEAFDLKPIREKLGM